MSMTLEQVVAAYEQGKAEGKIYPTGFPWLDRVLGGGLLCHDMLVVGALDNVGKSRWCLASGILRAQRGFKSLYVSVEDSTYKVGGRVAPALADDAGVSDSLLCSFFPSNTEAVCHAIRTTHPDVSMVYVDYIQDLDVLDNQVIAKNLRALKQAVTERDAALVVTSQVTERRNAKGELIFPPNRFWLRGARELSQKADSVVMLWPGDTNEVNAILDKNKSGAIGTRAVHGPWYGGRLLDAGTLWEAPRNEDEETPPW